MKARRQLHWIYLASMAVVLATILTVLYRRTQALDDSAYFENVALLRDMKQLDARRELDVLKSRMGLSQNYDSLVDQLSASETLWQRLEAVARGDHGAAEPLMIEASKALHAALLEKTRLIEHFKTHNSVLRNSMAFLPTAADDVRDASRNVTPGQSAPRQLSTDVNKVLLAVMSYAQAPSDDDAAEIGRDLSSLADRGPTLPARSSDALSVFSSHVRTVLREQPVVRHLLDSISAVPTSQQIDIINNLLNDRQEVIDRLNEKNRMYLMVVVAALAALLLYAGVRLIRSRAQIDRVNKQLCEANAGLEQRVLERTRELSVAQGELITAARQAGMAEIANNVLHNVGNVLNSVNVSAGMVSNKVRESKLQGLNKAVQLMDSHSADLGVFLTEDEKGKMLPGYLSKLAGVLSSEQQSIVDELEKLTKSVDHIKDIVATQQAYSGTVSAVEVVRLPELFEDALRMNEGSLTRHCVAVTCETNDIPPLLLDKHRLLQILINLVSNSKNAMDGIVDRPCQIKLRAQVVGEDEGRMVRISVIDNGQGIEAENLQRVFVHGFTTRKNGHGFGLHSCAIAAKDLGGSLEVHSDGCDKGATFVLEVPFRTPIREKVEEYA